ncbi:pirin [Bombella intestini]|uniref:Pirin n=1 Tax=Bombella intestini TaxID=1539051 RepID=A0A1S8GP27_9PROT|nr:pirin family protein [Bombella intestini]OOL17847.1 pirin [Bombella intestini]
MIDIRPFAQLGHADHGWLDARHHFSFAHYFDPNRMGWGRLRVWNDDTIAPNTGFDTHPHKDMEIITYVRRGAITHRDSLGNTGRTEAGDVQVMSAGTGIFHSEYNLEPIPTQIFQIWITPTEKGHKPSWATRRFPKQETTGQFTILASGYADDKGALPIHTEARVLGLTLQKGQRSHYTPAKGRMLYLVLASGSLLLNGQHVTTRSGAAISEEEAITLEALDDTEIVLVDTIP